MNKAKKIFQILCQANPIFRKWLLKSIPKLLKTERPKNYIYT